MIETPLPTERGELRAQPGHFKNVRLC
jgi:hypothetical protein